MQYFRIWPSHVGLSTEQEGSTQDPVNSSHTWPSLQGSAQPTVDAGQAASSSGEQCTPVAQSQGSDVQSHGAQFMPVAQSQYGVSHARRSSDEQFAPETQSQTAGAGQAASSSGEQFAPETQSQTAGAGQAASSSGEQFAPVAQSHLSPTRSSLRSS